MVRTLPENAIVLAEGRKFIFLLDHSPHHSNEISEENHPDDEEIEFVRLEVSTGATQLGFVEVTPLSAIPKDCKIVINGAYYLQSHLQKSEGGGGHEH
jgi:cobalt-zinc-cadmium efflux system membrane fusion protein